MKKGYLLCLEIKRVPHPDDVNAPQSPPLRDYSTHCVPRPRDNCVPPLPSQKNNRISYTPCPSGNCMLQPLYPRDTTKRLHMDPANFKKPKYVKARVPRQPNDIDCDVHCFFNLNQLFEDPENVKPSLIKPDPSSDRVWVPSRAHLLLKRLVKILKAKEYEVYRKESKLQ
ncbi:hypothetical protein K501DRAFT_279395 [Backusella circina FSU 941]|nr:hypothetical protein K501DRAFT_279395 [Backusella circina FSU 941]